jgi:3,4-dihydroxy 2-butanone 4-phosphate synthase/GTP cyclohydrolase II
MKKRRSRPSTASPFDSIETTIAEIRRGRMVIVTDDPGRENEGDLVMAAEKVTPTAVNFMTKHGRGLICVPATAERLRQLGISHMVAENRESHRTAFMVSVDARKGVATGISAHDRARTILAMADPRSTANDLVQPGHIFPLQARSGGVLNRAGHTEASVDLAWLAGLAPVGVICEILNPDGTMARLPELVRFRRKHRLRMCSIRDLIAYRRIREKLVEHTEESDLSTPHGRFRLHIYRSRCDGLQHLALVYGRPRAGQAVLVRVQAECVASDVFHSNLFGQPRLVDKALQRISREGCGVLLYMRQGGWRPVTDPDAELHLVPHLREYGLGAQILVDLGVRKIRLLVTKPKTVVGLQGYGLEIVQQVPLK